MGPRAAHCRAVDIAKPSTISRCRSLQNIILCVSWLKADQHGNRTNHDEWHAWPCGGHLLVQCYPCQKLDHHLIHCRDRRANDTGELPRGLISPRPNHALPGIGRGAAKRSPMFTGEHAYGLESSVLPIDFDVWLGDIEADDYGQIAVAVALYSGVRHVVAPTRFSCWGPRSRRSSDTTTGYRGRGRD
jgi:hypothetical protein